MEEQAFLEEYGVNDAVKYALQELLKQYIDTTPTIVKRMNTLRKLNTVTRLSARGETGASTLYPGIEEEKEKEKDDATKSQGEEEEEDDDDEFFSSSEEEEEDENEEGDSESEESQYSGRSASSSSEQDRQESDQSGDSQATLGKLKHGNKMKSYFRIGHDLEQNPVQAFAKFLKQYKEIQLKQNA